MEMEDFTLQTDILQREEDCRKALKTVCKAILMRIFVMAILIWTALTNGMQFWVIGLLVMVMIINLSGCLPLFNEWKKQRQILKNIIAEEEM